MLWTPSQVNLKISPPWASLPDTHRFCADAVEQIKITAPNHAILLSNCPTRSMADVILVSVSLAFIVVPMFGFLLVCFSYHRGTAGSPARYNTESLSFFEATRVWSPQRRVVASPRRPEGSRDNAAHSS